MKKAVILILVLVLGGLCSCGDSGKDSGISSSTSSDILGSSSADSSSKIENRKLNEDLLSGMGLTYGELEQRYGEMTDVSSDGGGVSYAFENGYGWYSWSYSELDYGREIEPGEGFPIMRDEAGNIIKETAPFPKIEAVCKMFQRMEAAKLFLKLDQTLSVAQINDIYDLEILENMDGEKDNGFYWVSFDYNDYHIWIRSEEKGMISPDSLIDIQLKYKEE